MCKVFGGMQHHRIAQVSCLARKSADKNITFGVAVASLRLEVLLQPLRSRSSFDASQPSCKVVCLAKFLFLNIYIFFNLTFLLLISCNGFQTLAL